MQHAHLAFPSNASKKINATGSIRGGGGKKSIPPIDAHVKATDQTDSYSTSFVASEIVQMVASLHQ